MPSAFNIGSIEVNNNYQFTLYVCVYVSMFVPSACLSARLFLCVCVCTLACLPVCLQVLLFLCVCVCVLSCMSACLSLCPSVSMLYPSLVDFTQCVYLVTVTMASRLIIPSRQPSLFHFLSPIRLHLMLIKRLLSASTSSSFSSSFFATCLLHPSLLSFTSRPIFTNFTATKILTFLFSHVFISRP